jgi:hypothetical protein
LRLFDTGLQLEPFLTVRYYFFPAMFEIMLIPVDEIKVVHISAIEFYAEPFFDEMVEPGREKHRAYL